MPDLVITLIGTDRPRLVESVAAAVAEHGTNWQEGRMAHLGSLERLARDLMVEIRLAEVPTGSGS